MSIIPVVEREDQQEWKKPLMQTVETVGEYHCYGRAATAYQRRNEQAIFPKQRFGQERE